MGKITFEYKNREIMKIMAEFYFGKDYVRDCVGAMKHTKLVRMRFYKQGVGYLILHREA